MCGHSLVGLTRHDNNADIALSLYICACIYVYTAYAYTVVVVVDSYIQRIVLATEEITVTQKVSHRPIKCQPRSWSRVTSW